jgi:hypothetical protein
MTPVDEYIDSVKDLGSVITGKSAPHTGYYYTQIYGGDALESGTPTLNVTLEGDSVSQQTIPVTSSVPINGLTDEQILEIIKSGQQITTDTQLPTGTTNTNTQVVPQATAQETTDSLPIGSIFLLILLLAAVGFVYAIVRIWQDHQMQKVVLNNIKHPEDTPPQQSVGIVPPVVSSQASTSQWRADIEAADNKLKALLAEKGVAGETVADQLKVVGAGQFTSLDIAWEAHQSAEKLLAMHDLQTHDPAVQRTLRLFNQVFADHGVI